MGAKGTKLTQDDLRELQKATYCKYFNTYFIIFK